MKNKILLLFLVIINTKIVSQVNLVPNAGFEQYTTCPTFGAQWNVCTGWNNVNMNVGVGYWGTPDYFNACGSNGVVPPGTFSGFCSPHLGNAMMGLVVYNVPYPEFREYLSTELSCSMTPGNTYTVSFWLTNGYLPFSPWTIKNMGIYFSASPLSQSGWGLINAVPQCEITSNITTTVWTQYSFTVSPTANWKYLTIGSFRSDANNLPTQSFTTAGSSASSYANYFIDDIAVMSASSGNFMISPSASTICSGQTATLNALGASSYTWSTGAINTPLVVSPTVTTIYTALTNQGYNCSNNLSTAVTISVVPLNSVAITYSPNVCANSSLTLTAIGANSFTWSTGATGSVVVVNPNVNTSYTVAAVNAVCASGNSAIANINVYPLPILNVIGNQNICIGQTATLSASGASNYLWNNGSTATSIVVSPPATTIYSITGTSAAGCTANATQTLNVNPYPNLSVLGNNTVCAGQTATLLATGANSYVWNNNLPGAFIATSPQTTTTFSLSGNSAANCQSTLLVTVYVSTVLSIGITGNTLVCRGDLLTLNANGATTYSWNGLSGGSTYTAMPLSSMVFTVSGRDNQNKCNGTSTIAITLSDCLQVADGVDLNADFRCFPNPFVNELVLVQNGEHGILNIELISSLGQLVCSLELLETERNKVWNLGWINAGTYLLKVSGSKGTWSKIVIKKN